MSQPTKEDMEKQLRILISNTKFLLRQPANKKNVYKSQRLSSHLDLYVSIYRFHCLVQGLESRSLSN